MLRLQEQSVTGTAEDPREYADDMVWRVRLRGRSEDEGDDAWLYVILVLEFQAEVDFLMPPRIRNYVDNFHMGQWRGKYSAPPVDCSRSCLSSFITETPRGAPRRG